MAQTILFVKLLVTRTGPLVLPYIQYCDFGGLPVFSVMFFMIDMLAEILYRLIELEPN